MGQAGFHGDVLTLTKVIEARLKVGWVIGIYVYSKMFDQCKLKLVCLSHMHRMRNILGY